MPHGLPYPIECLCITKWTVNRGSGTTLLSIMTCESADKQRTVLLLSVMDSCAESVLGLLRVPCRLTYGR